MLLMFVGDCHYQINRLYSWTLEWQKRTGMTIDAIVHVGDYGIDLKGRDWMGIWSRRSVPILTYVCMGNHEDIDSIVRWQAEPDRIKNLHLLPDGGITDVLGVQVGSVWGNYSPRSWLYPERVRAARKKHGSLHNSKAMHILRDSVDNLLADEGHMDVLITHDCASNAVPKQFKNKKIPDFIAPILGLDPDETNQQGCPGFNELLSKFKPEYYFYGHFHVRDNNEVEGTKVLCLNAFDFDPNSAIEILDFSQPQ
ncbi:MAG: metallophosphoesterase [Candidatus Acidiferrales bacterium]